MTRNERLNLIDRDAPISVRKQADLLSLARSGIYYKSRPVINIDSEIANMVAESYLNSNCRYGYRKITKEIQQVMPINHKKVMHIMQAMKIQGLYPKPKLNTSLSSPEHKKYPYLLNGLRIAGPNHVWSTDITYIKMEEKFVYLMAVIDLYSRYIVGYELSHNLEAGFCIELVRNLLKWQKPEIFNTDQGAQYTSKNFTDTLIENNVKISMDHKGRCFDNILIERFWRTLKQEAIYFYRPESLHDLNLVLGDFINWYNNDRLHQSLGYKTPHSLYIASLR